MDHDSTERPSGKMESLPKDDLLKFIKRQLKKKILDLEEALEKEKEEVNSLELEKKEWIARDVTSEFEKKELEFATRLAAEMLEENHELHGQNQSLKTDKDDVLRNETPQAMRTSFEKLQGELDSQELTDGLSASERECEELKVECDTNDTLKEKTEDLEANPVEYNKLKDELRKLKDYKMLAEQDSTAKAEKILNFVKEIKKLRHELAEKNKIIIDKTITTKTLKVENSELSESLKSAQAKCHELQAEIQKKHVEKEKYLKTVKTMKTKMEHASLIEEELRKQLNSIVGQRDEMLKKNLKLSQKQKAKKVHTDVSKKEELKNQMSSLENENAELRQAVENHIANYEELQCRISILEKENAELNKLEAENAESNKLVTANVELKAVMESNNMKSEKLHATYEILQNKMNNSKVEGEAIVIEEKDKLYPQNQETDDEIQSLRQARQTTFVVEVEKGTSLLQSCQKVSKKAHRLNHRYGLK